MEKTVSQLLDEIIKKLDLEKNHSKNLSFAEMRSIKTAKGLNLEEISKETGIHASRVSAILSVDISGDYYKLQEYFAKLL